MNKQTEIKNLAKATEMRFLHLAELLDESKFLETCDPELADSILDMAAETRWSLRDLVIKITS